MLLSILQVRILYDIIKIVFLENSLFYYLYFLCFARPGPMYRTRKGLVGKGEKGLQGVIPYHS